MFFQMPQVHVFRVLLFFVGLVDEDIEAVRVAVSGNNRKELLFMKYDHILNSRAEQVQKPPGFLANAEGRVRLDVPFRFATHRIHLGLLDLRHPGLHAVFLHNPTAVG